MFSYLCQCISSLFKVTHKIFVSSLRSRVVEKTQSVFGLGEECMNLSGYAPAPLLYVRAACRRQTLRVARSPEG